MDVNKIARAIEADAGESLPDLRQALDEAKARVGRVTCLLYTSPSPRD